MKTVLLIDDNTIVINALARYLEGLAENISVFTAANGQEGCDVLKSRDIDLIVTDLQMPVMDGYGVIDFRNRCFPDVPVIAMTGNPCSEVSRMLKGKGVNTCLEKPFDYVTVVNLIEEKLIRRERLPVEVGAA